MTNKDKKWIEDTVDCLEASLMSNCDEIVTINFRRKGLIRLRDILLDIMLESQKDDIKVIQTTQWHKVEDELPKKSGEYIVEVYDTEENRNYTDIGEIDCDGVVKKWNYKSTVKVLAWIPLPKWEE